MAKFHTVVLVGGPMNGNRVVMDPAHSRRGLAQPIPVMNIQRFDPKEPLEPFRVTHIEYDILGGYAPYPDAPEQVYRLGIMRGLDPAIELLKLLLKGNHNG